MSNNVFLSKRPFNLAIDLEYNQKINHIEINVLDQNGALHSPDNFFSGSYVYNYNKSVFSIKNYMYQNLIDGYRTNAFENIHNYFAVVILYFDELLLFFHPTKNECQRLIESIKEPEKNNVKDIWFLALEK